jgi:hypothetical protein
LGECRVAVHPSHRLTTRLSTSVGCRPPARARAPAPDLPHDEGDRSDPCEPQGRRGTRRSPRPSGILALD